MIPSLVGTHDTATAEYFDDSRVCLKKCARGRADCGTSGSSIVKYLLAFNIVLDLTSVMYVSQENFAILDLIAHQFFRKFDDPSHLLSSPEEYYLRCPFD